MYLLNRIAILLLLFFVAYGLFGCAKQPIIYDATCMVIRPILVSKDDKLTADTARQIYELDALLEVKCGKP